MNHFFDIGANVGQTFDDYLCKTNKYDGYTVWCFEPSPRHVPALMNKAVENSKRYTINVCPFGLRGRITVSKFYQKDDPRGDSFESYLASDHETKNMEYGYAIYSPAIGIADFIKSSTQPSERISLKIDAEGSEYDILSGLLGSADAISRIDEIYVEWHTIKSNCQIYSQEALKQAYAVMGIELKNWMF